MSPVVKCADQAEADRFRDKLQEGGGKPVQCGRLADRFGETMKLDIAALQRAYDGG
jgi:two-component system sensor histidine kinase QseC